MAAGFVLAVALMQPAPPRRIPCSRNVSAPGNTSKPPRANASRNACVFFQSPPLSFMPAVCWGYAFSSRSTRPRLIGTWATGGM